MSSKPKLVASEEIYNYTINELKQLFADECGVAKEQVEIQEISVVKGDSLNGMWKNDFAGIKVIVKKRSSYE